MFLQIDNILWIYLQNIILLPVDYLIETEEYDIFKNAQENNTIYILSLKDIYNDLSYDNLKLYKSYKFIYFKNFESILNMLLSLLDDTCYKKQLITKSISIIKLQKVEKMLYNCSI